jgi:CheY-like chemotaxis protein
MGRGLAEMGQNPEGSALKNGLGEPSAYVDRHRILIVEDDHAVLAILSKAFEALGFEVAKAKDGLEGWRLVSGNHFDLVLTDLGLPGLDGLTLASRSKESWPGTPVVLMTGDAPKVNQDSGCIDVVLIKPFKLADIVKILDRLGLAGMKKSRL